MVRLSGRGSPANPIPRFRISVFPSEPSATRFCAFVNLVEWTASRMNLQSTVDVLSFPLRSPRADGLRWPHSLNPQT